MLRYLWCGMDSHEHITVALHVPVDLAEKSAESRRKLILVSLEGKLFIDSKSTSR